MNISMSRRAFLAAVSASAGASIVGSKASFAAGFEGKTLEFLVGSGAGGSNDLYARFIGKMLAPQLEGRPAINIRNMPGGATIVASNHFETVRNDGTTSCVVTIASMLAPFLNPGDAKIKYNPSGWIPYLVSSMGYMVYVKKSSGISSVETLKQNLNKVMNIGLGAPVAGNYLGFLSLDLLGFKLRPVMGIDGGENRLAFERGEFNVMVDSAAEFIASTKDASDIYPLFTLGALNDKGEIVRDPNAPDVMTFHELYRAVHGKDLSGQEADLWMRLFPVTCSVGKCMVLPKNTPADIVEGYRAGVEKMVKDPAWPSAAGPILGAYPQITGDAAVKQFKAANALTADDRNWIAARYKERFQVLKL